ncbi:MAG TPA: hypothetical protein VNB22_23625 [Pyrinomonadaceae bacterium]|jgi:hydrogenase maturation protease|nr:hypothetical protein [Pyrinomonadaceae bacterium]
MNTDLVKKIADAVLYEGYMLYPYRASSVKNRQRFNWGVIVPPSYAEAQKGTENRQTQTEVLVLGEENAELDLQFRFLHLREREVYQYFDDSDEFRAVESIKIGDQIFQTWQEAVEREVSISAVLSEPSTVADGSSSAQSLTKSKQNPPATADGSDFSFPADEETETLRDSEGKVVGKIVRRQKEIEGTIELRIEEQNRKSQIANRKLFKLSVLVSNTTPFENAAEKSRDEALAHSLVSSHVVLRVQSGEFISLLEPPDEFRQAIANCRNIATYPILVGENGERNCFLSSPIILYDYPEIAPESAGDLFDGGEIDEILTLRIMTMTDEEKSEMQSVDERSRKMLERTENLSAEQLMKMHGILRRPRAFGNKDFFDDDLETRSESANG